MAPSYWGAADPVFSIIGDLVTAWDSPEQYRKWLIEESGISYLKLAYQKRGMVLLDLMNNI